MLKIIFCLLVFAFIGDSATVGLLRPLKPSESYTHTLVVDEERPTQYVIFWKLLNDNEIQFEAHCRSTGWVGLGFSPNGGMPGIF